MIAALYFDYGKVSERLRSLGCTEVVDKVFNGKTQQYAVWTTPWGHRFMIPMGVCTMWMLDQIIARDVDGTRPTNH